MLCWVRGGYVGRKEKKGKGKQIKEEKVRKQKRKNGK